MEGFCKAPSTGPGTEQVLRNDGSHCYLQDASQCVGPDFCKGDLPFHFGSWALPSFSL